VQSTLWVTAFLFSSSLVFGSPSLAQGSATRIQFAKGSYCGSYSGNFSQGKQFVLNLARDQTLTVRNVGDGFQYDISVFGPTGQIRGRNISQDQMNYYTPVKGDYYIYMSSTTPFNAVEFCAY